MASQDVRATPAQPEAELLSAGSETPCIKLSITNVYNNSSSEEVTLYPTDTIGDLKRILEGIFSDRPAPHEQRLIFRGKQCEEGQQLGHIFRGMDLSVRHNLHLVTTLPTEQNALPTAAPTQSPRFSGGDPPVVLPAESSRLSNGGVSTTSNGCTLGSTASRSPVEGPGASAAGATAPKPEHILLSSAQIAQLQSQYQLALREQEQALQQQRQRCQLLSRQSRALAYQHGRTLSSNPSCLKPSQPRARELRPANDTEVATSAATHALGACMPGPSAGGVVRDVTDGGSAMIQTAGLGQGDEHPQALNYADPPAIAAPARVNRGRLFLQLFAVLFVFGSDAEEWKLLLLTVGTGVVFLYKIGFFQNLLSEQGGWGLWTSIRTGASVIPEKGGAQADARALFVSLFFSLFPPWKPTRSPEAIAAEAAAQRAAAASAAEAANQRAEADRTSVLAADITHATNTSQGENEQPPPEAVS